MKKCLICNKNYKNKNSLAQHVRFEHKLTILSYKLKFKILKKENFVCSLCKKEIIPNTYGYCMECYQKSDDRKRVAKKIVKSRPNYEGKNNPNYRNAFIESICLCGINFGHYRSTNSKYCSKKCKKQYSVSKMKIFKYKGFKLRSSWELAYAQYLDLKGYSWIYEPESFQTPYGFYTPDFWVDELECYVEIKGFFRDKESKLKFEEFSKNHNIILADKKYLESLGFSRINSGDKKGQLCLPVVQP